MKKCKHCSKEYVYKPHVFSSSSASTLYCSKECRLEVRKKVNAANKIKAKRKEKEGDDLYWILNKRISVIKSSAKERGLEFNLTTDDLISYFKAPCYYCNTPVNNINLDRIINSKGYLPDNIVSCCLACNMMKHKQSQEDFINRCKLIATVHK